MKFWHPKTRDRPTKRRRVKLNLENVVLYAIGDVHGCHKELLSLEKKIYADAEAFDIPKLIIMLGDYVDRGTQSAAVLDHLLEEMPNSFYRLCLLGNHDLAFLDFMDGKSSLHNWLQIGAHQTLFSYGIDLDYLKQHYGTNESVRDYITQHIPTRHVAFLRSLPVMAESDRAIFVHAGIRSGVTLDDQLDMDLLTIREDFLNDPSPCPVPVIHGHTPVESPTARNGRINLDTGAFQSGRLTALRVLPGRPKLLYS